LSDERASTRGRRGERVRLFVALVLPSQAIDELIGWRAEATRGFSGLRLLDPEQLHVTLCFLGWQPLEARDSIADVCRAVASAGSVSELVLGQPLWLPPRRPRVLAVELEDPGEGLAKLQSELSLRLEAGGWYAPERRKYMPHVTVARVRRGAKGSGGFLAGTGAGPRGAPGLGGRASKRGAPGSGARASSRGTPGLETRASTRGAPGLPNPPALSFPAAAVTLFRSRLSPAGAQYEALASVHLE